MTDREYSLFLLREEFLDAINKLDEEARQEQQDLIEFMEINPKAPIAFMVRDFIMGYGKGLEFNEKLAEICKNAKETQEQQRKDSAKSKGEYN